MHEKDVDKPLYLLIADWVMAENRWVTAKEIARQFEIDHCKAINTVSYILAEVGGIECETKTIPNQLEGRGCQCQRLVRVNGISKLLYDRLKSPASVKSTLCSGTPGSAVPPGELNREQKWQWMLSKTQRR